jgi:NTE family protein
MTPRLPGRLVDRFEGFDRSLVLAGGNALGAYHLGVCEDLVADDPLPGWVVGCSIGAVTGAILVGNAPEDRIPRLREFWNELAQPGNPWAALLPDGPWTSDAQARVSNGHGLSALLAGRPGLAAPRVPGLLSLLPFAPPDRALLDQAPLARTLARLVDWDRLNGAPERLSVVALDAGTGEEVWFDNREGGIEIRHVLASVAILPLYRAVEVDGRLLCDAGHRNNLPVERVFPDDAGRPMLCVASDLYGLGPVGPATLDLAATRAQDLGFAAQALRSVEGVARLRGLRRALDPASPPAVLAHVAHVASAHERTLKALDFSAPALRERAARGRADMAAARARLLDAPRDAPLAVVTPRALEAAAVA